MVCWVLDPGLGLNPGEEGEGTYHTRVIGGPIPEVSHWQRYVGVLQIADILTHDLVNTNNSVGGHLVPHIWFQSYDCLYPQKHYLHSFFIAFPLGKFEQNQLHAWCNNKETMEVQEVLRQIEFR